MSAAGELRSALLKLWNRHNAVGTLPTSGRFLFYELVSMGLIAKGGSPDGKKGRRSDQNMIDALTQLRKSGDIPWTDITDETRQPSGRSTTRLRKPWKPHGKLQPLISGHPDFRQ